MLSGDFQKVRKTIKSRDWTGLEEAITAHWHPREMHKSIMALCPALFEKTALFARPENDYRCIEELYFPAISTDELITVIQNNRRKFL